jgi:UDP-N-acetylmuramate dehydrogenase
VYGGYPFLTVRIIKKNLGKNKVQGRRIAAGLLPDPFPIGPVLGELITGNNRPGTKVYIRLWNEQFGYMQGPAGKPLLYGFHVFLLGLWGYKDPTLRVRGWEPRVKLTPDGMENYVIFGNLGVPIAFLSPSVSVRVVRGYIPPSLVAKGRIFAYPHGMDERTALAHIVDGLGFSGALRFDEPMREHTTFKVGGPAELWIRPDGECFPAFVPPLLARARERGIPVFILGGGANIVVSDRGLRGITLDTGGWSGAFPENSGAPDGKIPFRCRSGTPLDLAAELAARAGLGGLEFLAGMPGSAGGALWMNARCYERSVADALIETEILDEDGTVKRIPFRASDFGYKKSPFQNRNLLILSALFALERCPEASLRAVMDDHRRDREAKGHYRYPSAGSAFKNNRDFGKPTGKIIDELGLKGLRYGGASIAPWHGNLLINTGNASAGDIKALTEETAARVYAALGITLEPEILFVGF